MHAGRDLLDAQQQALASAGLLLLNKAEDLNETARDRIASQLPPVRLIWTQQAQLPLSELPGLAVKANEGAGHLPLPTGLAQLPAVWSDPAEPICLSQAQEGSDKVAETGTILAGVLSGISGINDKNMQIASAAEQQSTVADEINQKVLSISDVAVQTSAGAEQTASTSRELARLAEQLQALVGRFKLA